MLEPYIDPSANGYRLPTATEWEYAARGDLGPEELAHLASALQRENKVAEPILKSVLERREEASRLPPLNDGVTGNGTQNGLVQFAVPTNAPSLLFYNCQFHSPMTGRFNIEDQPIVRLTSIDVGGQVILTSTGTDALNLCVDTSTNLVEGFWLAQTLQSNVFLLGTNSTSVELPAGPKAFFRVKQDLP